MGIFCTYVTVRTTLSWSRKNVSSADGADKGQSWHFIEIIFMSGYSSRYIIKNLGKLGKSKEEHKPTKKMPDDVLCNIIT